MRPEELKKWEEYYWSEMDLYVTFDHITNRGLALCWDADDNPYAIDPSQLQSKRDDTEQRR